MTEPAHPEMAWLYDPVMALPERYLLGEHRRVLTAGLSGRVLDVGAGTGAQFPYFADRRGDIASLHGVEPDPHMRRQAGERADRLGLDVDLEDAGAEALPYDDDSFDYVVASLVFCTIPDPAAALDEVARVLAPGGEFRFFEHVRASGATGVAHDLLAPAWHAAAGGCNLDRRTGELFCTDGRFELLAFDRFDGGLTRLLPLIRGRLRRRPDPSLLSRLAGRSP
jgi:SAM-dependent methyltransferase